MERRLMRQCWGQPCSAYTVIMMLLSTAFTSHEVICHSPKQHLTLGEHCGENRSCSTNQDLHCSKDNVCVCPIGSSFLQTGPEDLPKCRVKPGEKCSITNTTAPICVGNYQCIPENQNASPNNNTKEEEVNAICICSEGNECNEVIEIRNQSGEIQKPKFQIISYFVLYIGSIFFLP